MGREALEKRRAVARLKQFAAPLALGLFLPQGALALGSIDSGGTYNISTINSGDTPTFNGGTLVLNNSNTIPNNFNVNLSTTSLIDAQAHNYVFTGIIADSSTSTTTTGGQLTFEDTVGGGVVTLAGVNTMTGAVQVNSGVTLALSGAGSIATATTVGVGGTFDISGTSTGASIVSLTGAGNITLGSQSLTLTNAAGTFSGVISGSGKLVVSGGSESLGGANTYTGGTSVTSGTLTVGDGTTNGSIVGDVATNGTIAFNRSDSVTFNGVITGSGGASQTGTGVLTLTAVETYTGTTTISAGTLALAPGASIASSSVNATGIFDISATSGTSIRALIGSGTVELGSQTLTFTGGSGSFSGTINGSGNIVVSGGSQSFTGALNYTGTTTVTGGTLILGAASVTNNISNAGTVSFTGAVNMSGVISGSGGVSTVGSGIATISSVQTYTGATSVNVGTLALSGAGSIASSSGLSVIGTFDISAAAGNVAIPTLSGTGTVQLGSRTLTLSNASGTFGGTLAGTGGFELASGTETLSGGSTLTGQVTISGGTLYVAASSALATASRVVDNSAMDISASTDSAGHAAAFIQSLSGSGSIALGSHTLVLNNADAAFSGTISGSGGVTVAGGTETLTGANTYTGLTTITGGVLAISGGGSLATTSSVSADGTFDISAAGGNVTIASLSGAGSIVLGGNSLVLSAASGNFTGVISGTGGLTVTGGTQVLSGNNSYTGATLIDGGTLQIGNAGTSGLVLGNITDNGTLAFDRADTVIVGGAISGSGRLIQIGSGTLALTGTDTYGGGTVISSGTLQVGNGGTTGSITGDVTDNGTLAFARSDAITFGGAISGSGAVSQIGTGTLTLTTASTYTGTTTIANGSTLVLAAGAGIASSADVVSNGGLDISAVATPRLASLGGSGSVILGAQTLGLTAGADTFSGAISGTGGLGLSGGKQILSGVNSYTGATSVTGGTLTVNGSIASSSGVSVIGGTLAGNGTTSSVTVSGGGTLAPGSAGSGTLKVNGNLGIASDGNFVVSESSAGTPSVSVSGVAAVGGTLSVASADGTYTLGQKTTVLSAAGGVSGSFTPAAITSTGAQFKSSVTYDASHVYLEIDLAKLSPLLPTGATVNQAAPVAGIDRAIAAGTVIPVGIQNLGNLTSANLAAGASQLSGEIGADLPRAATGLMDPFMDALFGRLQDGSVRRGAWGSVFTGSDLAMGDTGVGSQKFKAHADGVAGGMDWQVSKKLTLGVAFSAANSGFHVAGSLGDGKADAFQAGVYGVAHMTSRLYGAFAAVLGVADMTTNRSVTISGTDQLMGKVKPLMGGLRYETGINLDGIAPYAAIAESFVSLPSYGETAVSGASTFALTHAAKTANDASLELGARQGAELPFSRNWTIDVSDRLAWSHLLAQPWNASAAFSSVAASDFTVYGAKEGRDGALVSLGVALRNRNGLGFDLHIDGRGSDRSQSYYAMGGLNYTW